MNGNLYTFTGQIAYPAGAPSILDIAVSLSRECRYAGAGVYWWPVALHTFVVSDLLPPNVRIHGLLHDACECILGDIPKPAKSDATKRLEDELTVAIYKNFDIPLPTSREQQMVHAADEAALHGEVYVVGTKALRAIYPHHPEAEELVDYYHRCYPVEDCVDPNGPCVKEFLRRFDVYGDHRRQD
jgi:hypothetical protein